MQWILRRHGVAARDLRQRHGGAVEFDDVVKGHLKFESELLDDFVLVKSSGVPTFMFAGAVDDHLMNITHVIRGDDHLSNTPRQIQIYDALGWTQRPIYAHISMIHGPDGSREAGGERHRHRAVREGWFVELSSLTPSGRGRIAVSP